MWIFFLKQSAAAKRFFIDWRAVVSTGRRTTQKIISKMMVRLSSCIAQFQRSFAVDVAERGLPNSDTVLRTI